MKNIKNLLKIKVIHVYFPLALGFLGLMYWFRGDALMQVEIVVAGAVAYIAVALLHHHLDKSLTVEIIIEYILIAALVLVLLNTQLLSKL